MASGRQTRFLELPFLFEERFSFTFPGAFWVNYEWLFQKLVYGVFSLGSFFALAGLRAALCVLIVCLLAYYCLRLKTEFFISKIFEFFLWSVLIAGLISPRASMQPELLGLLFLVFFFYLRDRLLARDGRLAGLLYSALFVLWANIHASFIYALGLLGLQIVARLFLLFNRRFNGSSPELSLYVEIQRLAALLGLGFFAALINPYGFKLYGFIASVVRDSPFISQAIAEWHPIEFEWGAVPFWLYNIFGLWLIGHASWRQRELQVEALFVWLACGLMAFAHNRNAAVFAVSSLPYLARCSVMIMRPPWLRLAPLVYIFFLTVLGFFAASTHLVRAKNVLFLAWRRPDYFSFYIAQKAFPVKAFDFISRHKELLSLHAMTEWGWGGYAQWRAGAQGLKIFWDGRYLFHNLLRQASFMAQAPKTWNLFLSAWRVDLIVRPRPTDGEYFPVAMALPGSPAAHLLRTKTALYYDPRDWALIWWDETSVVLARRSALPKNFLTRHEYRFRAPLDFHLLSFQAKQGAIDINLLAREMRRNQAQAGPNFFNRYFLDLIFQTKERGGRQPGERGSRRRA